MKCSVRRCRGGAVSSRVRAWWNSDCHQWGELETGAYREGRYMAGPEFMSEAGQSWTVQGFITTLRLDWHTVKTEE